MNPQDLLDDWNADQRKVLAVQHPLVPELTTRRLREIYRMGTELNPEHIDSILFQPKAQLRKDLQVVIQDAVQKVALYQKYLAQFDHAASNDPDFPDPTYFLAHALLLRAECKCPGIWEDLLPMLGWDEAQFEVFFDSQTADAVLFAMIGVAMEAGGLENLEGLILERGKANCWKKLAVEAIGQCAHHDHGRLREVRSVLDRLEDHFKQDGHSPEILAHIQREISSLQLDAAAPHEIDLFEHATADKTSIGLELENSGSLNNWAKIEILPMTEILAWWGRQNRFADFEQDSKGGLLSVSNLKPARTKSRTPHSQISKTPQPKRVGRNAPCPCGSGLKFKKCHGR